MKTTRLLALAALTVLFLFEAAPVDAAGPQYYAAGTIRNDLPVTMAYQYKVNDGAWVTLRLAPGQKHEFSFLYPQASHGKTVHIRFDHVANDGNRVTFHNTTLAMHVCKHPSLGWSQVFIPTNSGRNVALSR